LLVFPQDSHSIDRPASEADHWLAIAHWIDAHLSNASSGSSQSLD